VGNIIPLARLPWRSVRAGYLLQERIYRRILGLQPVGELIYVGRTHYHGPGKILADRTRISAGDPLGTIHLDNLRLAAIEHRPDSQSHEFAFIRLLRSSLVLLAQRVQADPGLKDLVGFRGVTWIPSRGRHLGFETEPLAAGLRARWLRLHFRVMLYALRPETKRSPDGLQPHVYWLTRRQLLNRYARKAPSVDVKRLCLH
jgi:hypothetical protein